MAVYIDDARAGVTTNGEMVQWSHLIADTTFELATFAQDLNLNTDGIREPSTGYEHYEVPEHRRVEAIAAGAVEVTVEEAEAFCVAREAGTPMEFHEIVATIQAPTLGGRHVATSQHDLPSAVGADITTEPPVAGSVLTGTATIEPPLPSAPPVAESPITFDSTVPADYPDLNTPALDEPEMTSPVGFVPPPEDRNEPAVTDTASPDPQEAFRAPVTDDLAQTPVGAALVAHIATLRAVRPKSSFLTRVFGDTKAREEEKPWVTGLRGEVAVGKTLSKVKGWHVLHSVPVGTGNSDIDHVLIGPGGIITINTKTHPKRKVWVSENVFTIDGNKQQHLRNSRHESERAARLLTDALGWKIPVTGAVILCEIASLSMNEAPKGVVVLKHRDLSKWLKKRPSYLTAEQVDNIYAIARQRSTWQPHEQ